MTADEREATHLFNTIVTAIEHTAAYHHDIRNLARLALHERLKTLSNTQHYDRAKVDLYLDFCNYIAALHS